MSTNNKGVVIEKKYILTFCLITSLFALWGVANDITNPLVAAFKTVMEISNAQAAWIQGAFYGGYATMAIPAALFIRKFSYKSGILLGLALYAVGAFLFIPAAFNHQFASFCIALYILTFGLAFLETTASPYILSLGSKETATRRLNFAQAFNPMGSLLGMFVASQFILGAMQSDSAEVREVGFSTLDEAQKLAIRQHDLFTICNPYVAIGIVVLIMLIVIAIFVKSDKNKADDAVHAPVSLSLRRLAGNKIYREGVIAQFFYVAAQIMNWTFIIQYADRLGINNATAQMWNIGAMCFFLCGRFIATALMKYVNSSKLLLIFAICAACTTLGVIFIDGMGGLYCLVATSAFMSLMFPTIYGLALDKVEAEDRSLGAAFLVMAIVGGALMPLLQGRIIDLHTVGSMPAVNVSFVLPFICFIAVAAYGYRVYAKK